MLHATLIIVHLHDAMQLCEESLNPHIEEYEMGQLVEEVTQNNGFIGNIKINRSNKLHHHISKVSFRNMIKNLLKNSQEAGADKVIIYVEGSSIIIEDNGEGMTNDQLANMVENGILSTKSKDRGFGLKSIKRCSERHNMDLKIQRNPHRGLSIILTCLGDK